MKFKIIKIKWLFSIAVGVLMLIGVFMLGWWIGHPEEKDASSGEEEKSSIMWTCSMHPQIMQPDPGSCPICLMDLIPATGKGGGSDSSVIVSKQQADVMGLKIAPVQRLLATRSVSLVGNIIPDERYTNTITSRVAGRIERLYVDYTGISVQQGDHLAEIYSPDLLVAQKELIEAKKLLLLSDSVAPVIKNNRQRLYKAAREKLRLLEMTDEQIKSIESATSPSDRLTVYATDAGVVTKKHINKGDYVKMGTPLYTVSDLGTVWVTMDAYEQDLPWLRYAQNVTFTTPAVPGKVFTGSVAFIDPVLNPKTRTSRVRVNVKNVGMHLKPGMFVRARVAAQVNGMGQVVITGLEGKWISPMHPEIIKDKPGVCDICGMKLVQAEDLGVVSSVDAATLSLVVPHSAVLQTGKQAVVYKRIIKDDELEFEAVVVTLGHRVDDYYVVQSGLSDGDFVVTQGAFKIDSELHINAKNSMMNMPASYVGPPVPSTPMDKVELAKFKKALDLYLKVSDHLAHDQTDKAIALNSELASALSGMSHEALAQYTARVKGSQSAEDIKAWMDSVAIQFAEVIKSRAANQLEPLYLLYCPMARDGIGGHWLSRSHKVENPYFGSEMFGCGTVKSQLTVKAHVMGKEMDMKPKGGSPKMDHKNHNH